MKLFIHYYTTDSGRAGALLKIEWNTGKTGYCDVHCWPEYGEKPLDEVLANGLAGGNDPRWESVIAANAFDARFRFLQRNAFLGLALPSTHKLLTSMAEINSTLLAGIWSVGYQTIKLKLSRPDLHKSKELSEWIEDSEFKWRLDWGGALRAKEAEQWWMDLSEEVRKRIDYVEDPTRGEKVGIPAPWANDWYFQPEAKIKIFKPTHDFLSVTEDYERVIFSHSLEHSLGRSYALWMAAQFYRDHRLAPEVCGFDNGSVRVRPSQGCGFWPEFELHVLKWESLL